MVFKDTPRWAGWSTVLIGMTLSFIIQNYIDSKIILPLINKESLSTRESIDTMFILMVMTNIIICSLWFLGSRLFKKTSPAAYHEQVDQFFDRINTPFDFEKEHGHAGNDGTQFKLLGYRCLIYGTFLSLLVFIV